MRKEIQSAIITGFICLTVLLFFLNPFRKKEFVNIYDWYGVIPQSVLLDFERETGIYVHYDVFDNNETLDAKLLASNSGYDVVFPSITPYGIRHLNLGIYQKFNKKWLPNLRKIDDLLLDKIKPFDPHMDYFLPYYWGTTGIAFDEDVLEKLLPNIPKDSYVLLFDPSIVKVLAPYGISLLQEPVDVFPPFMRYIGLPDERSLENLWTAAQKLEPLCAYVRRFSSSRFVMDLVMGDVCIAQSWSGEALKAIEDAHKVGRRIRYIIPKEGADIWIDGAAIPKGAPNVKNAHAFLNFILRPDVSAAITNNSHMATMVQEARPLVDPEISQNPLVYPSQETLRRLRLSPSFTTPQDIVYERVMMRLWAQIKMQRPIPRDYFDRLVLTQKIRLGAAETPFSAASKDLPDTTPSPAMSNKMPNKRS